MLTFKANFRSLVVCLIISCVCGITCNREPIKDGEKTRARIGAANRNHIISASGAQPEIKPSFHDAFIEDSLVQVFISDSTGKKYPICLGTVISSDNSGSLALTAAHCVASSLSKNTRYPLYIKKITSSETTGNHSGVGERLYPITEIYRHPRFNIISRTPIYDLALLRSPKLRSVNTASIYRSRLFVSDKKLEDVYFPTLSEDGGDNAIIIWRQAFTTMVTGLFLGIRAPEAALCRGLSGAPLIVNAGKTFTVAAIVSRGPRDCNGESTASVVSSGYSGFIENIERDGTPKPA